MKVDVAISQIDMEWENTTRNLARFEPAVAEAKADIVVLPEMFATGFKLRPSVVAEPMDGEVVTTMLRWAREYRKAVVGSAVISEGGLFRNRQFFVEPSGRMTWYDKHHLFRPGGEARDYEPGKQRVIVEYMGIRFLLLVCYDLRFPVWSRNRGDYDAIIYSASWADDRREVWRTLLRPGPSRTSVTSSASTAWVATPTPNMRATRPSSTSRAARWSMPAAAREPSRPQSTRSRWQPSARSSPPGLTPTTSNCGDRLPVGKNIPGTCIKARARIFIFCRPTSYIAEPPT